MENDFLIKEVFLNDISDKAILKEFLSEFNLELDEDIEYAVGLYNTNDEMVGCGAYSGNILKCFAISEELRGLNALNIIVSHLINKQFERKVYNLHVYTKPNNAIFFQSLGFNIVEGTEDVVLLENMKDGIKNYITSLDKNENYNKNIGAIVMNCNPFTLGHKYIIEYAANKCDLLHIFIVEEDKSIFTFDVRYELVKQGIKNLDNVLLHNSGRYIISSSTFPTYFLKEEHKKINAYAELDLRIFAKHIAPALNITKRFIGQEPYCPVTNQYNNLMKTILPKFNIEVIEIARKEFKNKAISASFVRDYIKRIGIDEGLKGLVPETTFNYLSSERAKDIIFKIQNS